MIPKLLSTALLAVTTSFAAPLALADHRHHNDDYNVRVHYVERTYSHHDHGRHHGWHKHHHKKHHRHHDRHGHGSDYGYYERYEYRDYAPRKHHDRAEYSHERRSSSAAPVILGSVLGGVVGHEMGHGDPGHTAVGAVIGTVIGYDIARHR